MKKKLLVYAHYFYPDVASTAQILNELCEGLEKEFEITVISVVPSYNGKVSDYYKSQRFFKEKHKNIHVIRVRVPEFNKKNKLSRIRNIISYFINAIYATIKLDKQDIVFSISQPPILGGLLGVIGKFVKGARFVYNIQDFNPEQTEAINYSKNKLLIESARALDKLSCTISDLVILVGRDMQQTLINRYGNKKVPKNVVINNWIDEKQVYPLDTDNHRVLEFKKKYGLMDKIVFMYSGNIGLYYDLKNIIKVIEEYKDRNDIVFAFVGDGAVKKELVIYCEDKKMINVKFIPYQDKDDLVYSLNAADIHIVTNAKGIKGVSVPSKIYGVLAVGKPVLAILEKGSEARLLIEECGCGYCCEPGQYEEIKVNIEKIMNKIKVDSQFGMEGSKYIKNKHTKAMLINKYAVNINSIAFSKLPYIDKQIALKKSEKVEVK